MKNWFEIENVDAIDSPSLIIFEERVLHNINTAIQMVGSVDRLRPHVKTSKSSEITQLLIKKGIQKFKCATIAEAEMLALQNAQDVLLAYQPIGPKIQRFIQLINKYPNTNFSCLTDHLDAAKHQSELFEKNNLRVGVYIDLNVGMNRTGVEIGTKALELYQFCNEAKGYNLKGLHVYDGHFRNSNFEQRLNDCNESFEKVIDFVNQIKSLNLKEPIIIAGGSPTFSIHSKRKNIECSPGTFIYWDYGYSSICKEQDFITAAVLLTRVISIIDDRKVCIDLGHKSVASENDITKRVYFLNAEGLKPISQSEEHLVLDNTLNIPLKIGDVLYGIPYHICPTVALYEKVYVVKNNVVYTEWKTTARDRTLTI